MEGGEVIPDPEQVFIFCQKDFLAEDFAEMETMRKNGVLCDVTINAKGHAFKAHRLILATGIPLFRAMFAINAAGSKKKEIVCDEIDPAAMESLISYAYTGKIDITEDNVESVLSGSQYLHLCRVKEACYHFLASNLRLDNLLKVRSIAVDHDCFYLVEAVDNYIRNNFDAFCNSSQFLALKPHYLKKLLSRDDLNVTREEDTFQAVMKWVKSAPEERRRQMPDMLKEVRMLRLSPKYLVEQVSTEELIQKCPDSRDLVDQAKNYHLSPNKFNVQCSFSTLPRTPTSTRLERTLRPDVFGPGMYAICYSQFRRRIVKYFDPNAEEWVTVTSSSRYKRTSAVVASEDRLYDVGGKTIEELNLTTLQWTPLVFMSVPIYNAGLVLHRNRIYCIGGHVSSNLVRCFDLELHKWLKECKMTSSRLFPGVVSLKDYIYITGGCYGNVPFRSAERFDPQMEEWCEIAPMLYERWGHGCTKLNGKIYVCGGTSTETLRSAETYDPLTDQWVFIRSMKESRVFLSLVAFNGKLFAVGGMKTGKKNACDVEVYDPDTREWAFKQSVCYTDESETFIRAVVTVTA